MAAVGKHHKKKTTHKKRVSGGKKKTTHKKKGKRMGEVSVVNGKKKKRHHHSYMGTAADAGNLLLEVGSLIVGMWGVHKINKLVRANFPTVPAFLVSVGEGIVGYFGAVNAHRFGKSFGSIVKGGSLGVIASGTILALEEADLFSGDESDKLFVKLDGPFNAKFMNRLNLTAPQRALLIKHNPALAPNATEDIEHEDVTEDYSDDGSDDMGDVSVVNGGFVNGEFVNAGFVNGYDDDDEMGEVSVVNADYAFEV